MMVSEMESERRTQVCLDLSGGVRLVCTLWRMDEVHELDRYLVLLATGTADVVARSS